MILSKDNPNIEIPNVENQMNGCRILGVYTENYQVRHYQVTDLILLDALLDEAEYYPFFTQRSIHRHSL